MNLDEQLFRPIEEMDMSVRIENCFTNMGLKYVGDLIQCTEPDLLKQRNFGRKSIKDVREALAGMGLTLGVRIPRWKQTLKKRGLKESGAKPPSPAALKDLGAITIDRLEKELDGMRYDRDQAIEKYRDAYQRLSEALIEVRRLERKLEQGVHTNDKVAALLIPIARQLLAFVYGQEQVFVHVAGDRVTVTDTAEVPTSHLVRDAPAIRACSCGGCS